MPQFHLKLCCRFAFIAVATFLLATSYSNAQAPFVRRTEATEEDLRKQLLTVPDIGLSQQAAADLYAKVDAQLKKTGTVRPDCGGAYYGESVSKLGAQSLPWVTGVDATKGQDEARNLNAVSSALRSGLMNTAKQGVADSGALRKLVNSDSQKGLTQDDLQKSESVPALVQLLQAEGKEGRLLMVELLANVKDKTATAALVQRALFDISPKVRENAVAALADRPDRECRDALLAGFQYPWPAVADHAAEAIIALSKREYVGRLVSLTKELDPRTPFADAKGRLVVREVVRLNHLSNCLMCHPPSYSSSDLVRGLIPTPGQPPPPLYYTATRGSFARADVTYLRQDFSVLQSVPNPYKWAAQQRFDYLVRVRPAAKDDTLKSARPRSDIAPDGAPAGIVKNDANEKDLYPPRAALFFALRNLTGKDLGDSPAAWQRWWATQKQ